MSRILLVLTCLAGILFLSSCSNPSDEAEAPSGVSESQAEEESKVEGDASTEVDKDMPMSSAQARNNADAIYEEFDHRLPNARLIPTQTIVREMVSGFIERRFAEDQPDLTMFVGASFVWGYPLAEKYTLPYQYQVHSQRPTVNYSIYGASSVWIYSMLCMLENRKARPSRLILSVPYTNDVGRLVRNLEFEKGVQYADDVIASLYSCGDHHKNVSLQDAYLHGLTQEQSDSMMARKLSLDPRPNFAFGPLKPDYFATGETYPQVRDVWLESLSHTISKAVKASDNVTFVIPPVFLPAVEQAGFQISDVTNQVDDILMICNEIASENSNLSCFYPGEEFVNDVNNFADITHPNGIGFERYAKLMLEMERNSK